jgi:hypothetical protein
MYTTSRWSLLPAYSYVAGIIISALFLWATGLPAFIHTARAEQLELLSDTLTTSVPGVGADHTLSFTTPTGIVADGSTIEITMPNGFGMTTIGEDDIDIADDGIDLTTGSTCGSVQAAIATSSQTIAIELCNGGGGAIAAGSTITIEIGTNATSFGTGIHRVTNHATPGDYALVIAGTMADEGETRLVIVEGVRVTGAVNTYLSFAVNGVDAGESVNADLTPTSGTTTATSVPFGIVSPDTEYVLAQDLVATTNAVNGFMVTVEARADLTSGSGATINSFADGSGDSAPFLWQPPSAVVGNTDTYGHWGVTTQDATLSDNDPFGNALYAGDFIATPREVMYATSSADGTTEHIGSTRVGYKLEVSVLQEAARDYQTEINYVVSPVF